MYRSASFLIEAEGMDHVEREDYHKDAWQAEMPLYSGCPQQGDGNERWDIEKDTAEFLTSVMSLSRIEDFEEGMPCLTMDDLKIDEPVMHSDPDFDIARLRARNMVNLSVRGIEPASTNHGVHWMKPSLGWHKINVDGARASISC